jgi:hypothetical protein
VNEEEDSGRQRKRVKNRNPLMNFIDEFELQQDDSQESELHRKRIEEGPDAFDILYEQNMANAKRMSLDPKEQIHMRLFGVAGKSKNQMSYTGFTDAKS